VFVLLPQGKSGTILTTKGMVGREIHQRPFPGQNYGVCGYRSPKKMARVSPFGGNLKRVGMPDQKMARFYPGNVKKLV